ncbi:MAG: hypothetical protein IKJ51_00065 [Clostridia bacterium]|nr:hypothetical protein [Clostridia bacterium]
MDGKKKKLLLIVIVIVIGILLIVLDNASSPKYPSASGYVPTGGSASSGADCYYCGDTGKCPDCRGLKDCQFVYGASHRCVNGKIYYGGDVLECSACDGSGDCNKCDGTGRCPYCR